MARNYDVIVVGLGAMGSAATYALAARGLRVLGVDGHQPPHRDGSHHGESRIIRKAYYEHPAYVPLLERAFAAWRELEERAHTSLFRQAGGLMIGPATGELVPGVLASARAHRLRHELLSSDALAARYPQFRVDPSMIAVWEDDAGILFPEACVRAFLEGARAAHAELRYGEAAQEWTCGPQGVRVRTTRDRYSSDALVLAAGSGTGELVAELRAHLRVERQVVAHFAPVAEPGALGSGRFPIFCLEEPTGAFYYGVPNLGTGCKIARHHGGAIGAPGELSRQPTDADIADLRAFIEQRLPPANGALQSSAVCLYTNTPDFHFIIDRHPRHDAVILASVCSGHGFKFAPVMGEIIAELVQGRSPAFDLSMFQVARFL
ncbi:MAG TPA: N-methyl-L-tryptophan oxidase [Burkholderiales bacterium]|nr:N-methyl-L-tryptophan oxidase [Burkholderiales bacterium]